MCSAQSTIANDNALQCPGCQSRAETLCTLGATLFGHCPHCHHQFTTNLQKREGHAQLQTSTNEGCAPRDQYRERVSRHRAQDYLDHLRKISPVGRMLDIGPESPAFADEFRMAGWVAQSYEIRSTDPVTPRGHFSRGLRNIHSEILNQGHFYDLISVRYSLQQAANPPELLNTLSQHVCRDGYVLIENNDSNSLSARLMGNQWEENRVPRHLNCFTPKQMTHTMNKAGFARIKTGTPVNRGIIADLKNAGAGCASRHPFDALMRYASHVLPLDMELSFPAVGAFWSLYQKV